MDKNKDKMAPVDWCPSMRLSTWSDMVANIGPLGSGKPLRAAGVCNFSERQLQELLSFCRDNNLQKPAVVQNECHPLLQASVIYFLIVYIKIYRRFFYNDYHYTFDFLGSHLL